MRVGLVVLLIGVIGAAVGLVLLRLSYPIDPGASQLSALVMFLLGSVIQLAGVVIAAAGRRRVPATRVALVAAIAPLVASVALLGWAAVARPWGYYYDAQNQNVGSHAWTSFALLAVAQVVLWVIAASAGGLLPFLAFAVLARFRGAGWFGLLLFLPFAALMQLLGAGPLATIPIVTALIAIPALSRRWEASSVRRRLHPVAPMTYTPPDAVARPGQAVGPLPGSTLRGLAFAVFAVAAVTRLALAIGAQSGELVAASALPWVGGAASVLVALLLIAAAVSPRDGSGSAAGGVLAAIAYAAVELTIAGLTASPSGSSGLLPLFTASSGALLFVAWAAGRRLGAAAYLLLPLAAALRFGEDRVTPVIFGTAATTAVMVLGYSLFAVGAVVLLATAAGSAPAGRGSPVTGAARVALGLMLTSFCLNSVAGSTPAGANLAALIAVIAIEVAVIVLGHVGYVRAGRRSELGRGLAVTALILGYLVVVADIALVVWIASVLNGVGLL